MIFVLSIMMHSASTQLCARCILPSLRLNPSLILCLIINKQIISLTLGRTTRIGRIQQILNPQQHLLHGNRRTPPLLLIQNAQTDGTRGINVGMEEGGYELAFGRFGGIFLAEFEHYLVQASFPIGPLLARDARFPEHDVVGSVALGDGAGVEAEGMIAAPCLSFLC